MSDPKFQPTDTDTEKEFLRAEIEALGARVKFLERELSVMQGERLPQQAEEILWLLQQKPMMEAQIMDQTGISPNLVTFYLSGLSKKHFAFDHYGHWKITAEGTNYLFHYEPRGQQR